MRRINHSFSKKSTLALVLLSVVIVTAGCGGRSNRDKKEVEPELVKSPWVKTKIIAVTKGGLLSTNVIAVADKLSESLLHFVYFVDAHEVSEEQSNLPIEYTLRHLVWDTEAPEGESLVSTSDIVTLDNTLEFEVAIDNNNTLYTAYRGGNVAHCNTQQSDTMLAVKATGDSAWEEYVGAIGYSGSRNPAYTDGDAGDYPSLAIDSNGNVHIAFQFFWEGCDSNNALHPDVLYVQKPAGALDSFDIASEEHVEGNDYATTNYQNAVGYHNSLVVDMDDSPVIFYGAREINYNEHGLRVARTVNGLWQSEWIDKGCFITDISAAISPEGELGVAYSIGECTEHLSYTEDDGYALRYAVYSEGEWTVHTVDEATKIGGHTELAFDNLGSPAIAYYETESYGIGGQRDLFNLKLARLDLTNMSWFKQRVDEAGDIGLFNSLWFDIENNIYISSFSNTDNTVYLFTENNE
mgnify:CR=1 FL=1